MHIGGTWGSCAKASASLHLLELRNFFKQLSIVYSRRVPRELLYVARADPWVLQEEVQ